MTPDALTWGLVAATFVAAGFVKGVVGLGLPTVAMGVLSLLMAPVAAAATLVLPALAGMAIGQRLRERLDPARFRRWFFAGLVALGLYMVAQAVRAVLGGQV